MASNTVIQATPDSSDDQEEFFEKEMPNELGCDPNSLTQATIMMIDDESTTMEIMQTFLEDAGYRHFVLVEDATRAIEEIERHKPDILLLDLVMPGMTGFEILGQVRTLPKLKTLPVLILTSSLDPETKLQALDQGATDFLAKPVDPSELTLRVRNTLSAKAYQNQLAYHDALTNLPNRSLFLDRLDWFIQRSRRYQENLVLLHITLPQFRRVYTTFGPEIGDHVISQIAGRIQIAVRKSDIIGRGVRQEINILFRVGNEEFSVLCPNMAQTENATKIASRLLEILAHPFDANGTEVFIYPAIGIATYPEDATNMKQFIQCAIGASAQATDHEKGSFHYYSSSLNTQSMERLQLESDLRHAIEDEQFVLHYQPQIDVKTGKIRGGEALVRWERPDGSLLFPDRFISLAEETGLILPLGEWAIKEACAQLARWQEQGKWIQVAVNLSAKQFHEGNLVQIVRDALKCSNLDQSYLTLELTESLIMDNVGQAVDTLNELITLGIKISMDDFGTGYSSLSYLKHLPLHELKIDRSFLKDLTDNPKDKALVSAIIYLAHEFQLNVVAEGVENQEQHAIIAALACDEYQGYFFSPPISTLAFTAMLDQSLTSQSPNPT